MSRHRAGSAWAARAVGVLGAALVTGFFLLFLVAPLVESLRGAFFDARGKLTAAYLVHLFQSPVYLEGFENAILVALSSTALATAIGLPLALIVDRYEFPGRRALAALLPLPLLVPPFVGAIGIKQILGQAGALNALLVRLGWQSPQRPIDWLREGRFFAVVALTALHLYPVLYFNVSAALAGLHPEMEEAAENLGATRLRKLVRITLPLIGPSIFAAATIVFIWALTELGVPLMCDYTRITSVQIFAGLKDIGRNPFVYALVTVVLVATLLLYLGAKLLFARSAGGTATKGIAVRGRRRLGIARGLACTALLSLVVSVAALPNISVVLVSVARDWYATVFPSSVTLSHYEAALGHSMVVPSIGNSLRYVVLATALDLALGVFVAHVVVRTRAPGRQVLDLVSMLPLAVPGLVLAFGYVAISRQGSLLAFLNPARDPTALLVVAYAMRRLPFVVRSAAAGLSQIGVALEEAAASLGATPLGTWRRITLPLLGAHLMAGGVFAFALSMLEVSDSLILAQKQTTFPITKAIYELFQLLGDGRFVAAALGVWAMVFLACAVALARGALGRRFGGLFRV
jgi:iron(III) transport system permease protein